MQKYLLLLIACFSVLTSRAQKNGSVQGIILDTARQPVASVTVTLLQKKDSALVSFTMTDDKGRFALTGIHSGTYRLLFTHINYHNASRLITTDTGIPDINLDTIILYDRHRALQEVEVTAEAPPVTLIGDTIQYNAGSFKTQPNADVEHLLKKLPGIQVAKDGTIKAQGQKVNRVLVDGKEFFGTDPTIATKNLPADAVDKVQVYDRLSDAAQLTGFDDGNSEKTIDLKLKQEKKKGLFGMATAGAGTRNRYEGRFNVNSFKGARQFSAIGMANNTNAQGFSFMDLMNFTGEMNRLRQGGNGNISLTLNTDNAAIGLTGNDNKNGIKTIWAGGLNYNNTIGNKTDLTGNYFFNHYNPHQESNIQRQYFLPDSSYFYDQHAVSDNLNNSHRFNLSADVHIDSLNSIKISSSIGYQETSNDNNNSYKTYLEDQQPVNQGFSKSHSSGDGMNLRNDVLFRRKFRRIGRTLSLSIQSSFNQSKSNGSLFSVNQFNYTGSSRSVYDSINQQNFSSGNLNGYTARAVYTEPAFKHSLLEFALSHSSTTNTSDKTTYDYNDQNSKFDLLNDSLSNNFKNGYNYTNAGWRLLVKQKNISLAAGADWQQAMLEGTITASDKDSVIRRTFYNLLPSLRFKYSFTRYRNLDISYAAVTNQPDISQLQPVPDISDPLNIREGNPNLRQEFTHALQLIFMSVNPFENRNLFAFFNLQETQHKIVNNDEIDSLGIKHTQPVNVNGAYNMTGNINLGLPLHLLKGSVSLGSNMGYSKTKQFINDEANIIRTATLGPTVRLDIYPSDKLDLSLSADFDYYKTSYSLQKAFNTHYFSQQYESEMNWQLPADFYFTTSFTYTVNNQRAEGFNARVPLWNAAFSRQFLRFNKGELKLSVFDILDKNVGISRSSNQNYVEDSRINNLQRFFMLSFTYSLNKSGVHAGNTGGGVRIMRP